MTKKQSNLAVATTKRTAEPKAVSAQVVLKSLEKQSAPLIRKLSDFKIKDNDDYEKAFELTKDLKAFGKEVDRQLRTITDPLKQATDAARAIFRPLLDRVKEIDAAIKNEMLLYQSKLSKKKAALDEKFETSNMRSATYVKNSADLSLDTGIRKVWQAIAVAPELTPREYLVPDESKIKDALKAGKKVKGWEWKQVDSIAI